jgi:hypothetical protein
MSADSEFGLPDLSISGRKETSKIFQDPTKQRFADGEAPAEESARSLDSLQVGELACRP